MKKKAWLCGLFCLSAVVSLRAASATCQVSAIEINCHQEDGLLDSDISYPYSAVDFAQIYDQIFQASNSELTEEKQTYMESFIQYIGAFILTQYFYLEEFTQKSKKKIIQFIGLCKSRLGYGKKRRQT